MMRRSAIIIAIIVTVVLLGLGCIYYQLDPSQSGVFPRCPFLSLTGFKCPGCGSQRAIHALLHGDVGAAFGHNAMLLIALPWIAVLLVCRGDTHTPTSPVCPPKCTLASVAVIGCHFGLGRVAQHLCAMNTLLTSQGH